MVCSGVSVHTVDMKVDTLTSQSLLRRHKVAFLVHPHLHISAELAKVKRPLGWFSNKMYQALFKHINCPIVSMGKLSYKDDPCIKAGSLLFVPLNPSELLKGGYRVQNMLNTAVDRARDLGAKTVGLGSLIALASAGGAMFRHRQDIGVTNGKAFSAAMTFLSIQRLLALCPPYARIALVGVTESVGRCVAQLVASKTEQDLLLVARNQTKLKVLQEKLGQGRAQVSTCMETVRTADLVVLLGSAIESPLQSEHLKQGAIVLDNTQPRSIHPALLRLRPDVQVIDSGLVTIPGLNGGYLPKSKVDVCLAETLLLGLAGQTGHFSLGTPSVEQAQHMLNLATYFSHLGFGLAPMRSFGHPVHLDLPKQPFARQWVAA